MIPFPAASSLLNAAGRGRILRASKNVRCPNGLIATVTDTMTVQQAADGDPALLWDVNVSSDSRGFWTAPIASTVRFSGHTSAQQYWFGGATKGTVDLAPIPFGHCDHFKDEPALPPGHCQFKFGGDYADPTTPPNEDWSNQLVLPIWAYYSP
eukprot:SAG31_NODE_24682_length_476_cov_1.119363_1_plen_152_part_10